MIVIAARPSCGKTSLALNIADYVAVNLGLPVGIFSLEMPADQLTHRMICSRARVNSRDVRDGRLSSENFRALTTAAAKLAKCYIHIDDSSGLSLVQLRAKARRMHQIHGIKLFIVDYLQLLSGEKNRRDGRQQEVADISGGVKSIAKELNVPVIILSQLNRLLEKDQARRPRLSDLRDSGAIEQDADLVGFLYRRCKEEDVYELESYPVDLLIAKHRNGECGEIPLQFFKQITKFEPRTRI